MTHQLILGNPQSNRIETRFDWIERSFKRLEEVSAEWLTDSVVNLSVSGYIDIAEMTAPSNPAANTARFFVRDDGAGKTQLCVIFPSGSVTPIATET